MHPNYSKYFLCSVRSCTNTSSIIKSRDIDDIGVYGTRALHWELQRVGRHTCFQVVNAWTCGLWISYSECKCIGHVFKNVSQVCILFSYKLPCSFHTIVRNKIKISPILLIPIVITYRIKTGCYGWEALWVSSLRVLSSRTIIHGSLSASLVLVSLVDINNVTRDINQCDSFVFQKGEF